MGKRKWDPDKHLGCSNRKRHFKSSQLSCRQQEGTHSSKSADEEPKLAEKDSPLQEA
jgi:hypothetical protein